MWVLTVLCRGKKSVRPRKDERFVTEVLRSPLGEVKDISASGVCVAIGKNCLGNPCGVGVDAATE